MAKNDVLDLILFLMVRISSLSISATDRKCIILSYSGIILSYCLFYFKNFLFAVSIVPKAKWQTFQDVCEIGCSTLWGTWLIDVSWLLTFCKWKKRPNLTWLEDGPTPPFGSSVIWTDIHQTGITFIGLYQFFLGYSHNLLFFFIYRHISRHELFPIRAPLMALEHCIAPFLNSCDTDDDHRITLKEWAKCLELEEDEIEDKCDQLANSEETD